MRRLLTLAASFLFAVAIPLCAQHGGGHASSSGSHGGFSGGHASTGGSHGGFAGHSSFAGHAGSGPRGASHFGPGSGSRYGRGGHFQGQRYGRSGFRNGCMDAGDMGIGYGYPYYYSGIDPYWWWDTYSGDQDDAQQREEAAEMNAENLQEQQALRQQDQDGVCAADAAPAASARASQPASDERAHHNFGISRRAPARNPELCDRGWIAVELHSAARRKDSSRGDRHSCHHQGQRGSWS